MSRIHKELNNMIHDMMGEKSLEVSRFSGEMNKELDVAQVCKETGRNANGIGSGHLPSSPRS